MEIYIPKSINELRSYYKEHIESYPSDQKIISRIEKHTALLWRAFEDDNPVILNEINNYHPDYLGLPWHEIGKNDFTYSNAKKTVACQFGYSDFSEIQDEIVNVQFEKAVDLLLSGAHFDLKKLLVSHPDIVNQPSSYGHGATLLHYIGSNGVELYRQIVPTNLSEMMELLITHGADVNATMHVYGGDFKMIDLLNTSAHPRSAGILDDVNQKYLELI